LIFWQREIINQLLPTRIIHYMLKLRYNSFIFSSRVMRIKPKNETNKFISSLYFFWKIFKWPMAIISIIFSVISTAWLLKISRSKNTIIKKIEENWIFTYVLILLLALAVSCALSHVGINYWRLYIVFPFASFPLVLFIPRMLSKAGHKIKMIFNTYIFLFISYSLFTFLTFSFYYTSLVPRFYIDVEVKHRKIEPRVNTDFNRIRKMYILMKDLFPPQWQLYFDEQQKAIQSKQ